MNHSADILSSLHEIQIDILMRNLHAIDVDDDDRMSYRVVVDFSSKQSSAIQLRYRIERDIDQVLDSLSTNDFLQIDFWIRRFSEFDERVIQKSQLHAMNSLIQSEREIFDCDSEFIRTDHMQCNKINDRADEDWIFSAKTNQDVRQDADCLHKSLCTRSQNWSVLVENFIVRIFITRILIVRTFVARER